MSRRGVVGCSGIEIRWEIVGFLISYRHQSAVVFVFDLLSWSYNEDLLILITTRRLLSAVICLRVASHVFLRMNNFIMILHELCLEGSHLIWWGNLIRIFNHHDLLNAASNLVVFLVDFLDVHDCAWQLYFSNLVQLLELVWLLLLADPVRIRQLMYTVLIAQPFTVLLLILVIGLNHLLYW